MIDYLEKTEKNKKITASLSRNNDGDVFFLLSLIICILWSEDSGLDIIFI